MHPRPEQISDDQWTELVTLLESVAVYSRESFGVKGEPPTSVTPETSANMWGPARPGEAVDHLELAVASLLYRRGYAMSFNRNVESPPTGSGNNSEFVAALSQANTTLDGFDKGWQVYQVGGGGQVFVRKGDSHRSPMPGEYVLPTLPGGIPYVGAFVNLYLPRESHELQPGFYFAFGETLSDVFDDFHTLRFYFHSSAETAPELIANLSTLLNRYRVPFRMKTLAYPEQYIRRDATVLFIPHRYASTASYIVDLLPQALLDRLEPDVPLFTRRLREGVGVSQDPGTGESFGQSRCRALARAVVRAFEQGTQSVDSRLAAFRTECATSGIDFDRPYLNLGSTDPFVTNQTVEIAA